MKRILLLYRPSQNGIWIYHILFYLLTFVFIPLISVAALGAYLGPERTLEGLPAVLFLMMVAFFIRRRAVLAHNRSTKLLTIKQEPRTNPFPFPTVAAPKRGLFMGYIYSVIGTFSLILGFLGAGMVANGAIGIIIFLFLKGTGHQGGLEVRGQETNLPLSLLVTISIFAVLIGLVLLVFGPSEGMRKLSKGRRLRAESAESFLMTTERPVLLLRSFDDDTLLDPRPMDFFKPSYEERLCRILKELGPVVAIGRPGENLGFSGASRLYVADVHWQEAVTYLMQQAVAVLIVVGNTEGLEWEMSTVLDNVYAKRILFFFPYVYRENIGNSRIGDVKELYALWNVPRGRFQKMDKERQRRYEIFRQRYQHNINHDFPENIEDVLFLDFLPNGHPRLLKTKYFSIFKNFNLIFRHHRRLSFKMPETLEPFLVKLIYNADNETF